MPVTMMRYLVLAFLLGLGAVLVVATGAIPIQASSGIGVPLRTCSM